MEGLAGLDSLESRAGSDEEEAGDNLIPTCIHFLKHDLYLACILYHQGQSLCGFHILLGGGEVGLHSNDGALSYPIGGLGRAGGGNGDFAVGIYDRSGELCSFRRN